MGTMMMSFVIGSFATPQTSWTVALGKPVMANNHVITQLPVLVNVSTIPTRNGFLNVDVKMNQNPLCMKCHKQRYTIA